MLGWLNIDSDIIRSCSCPLVIEQDLLAFFGKRLRQLFVQIQYDLSCVGSFDRRYLVFHHGLTLLSLDIFKYYNLNLIECF